jgi:(4-(4-[2-(gamma-L-glutamylamino)ethyl]phenoxymethyl)furan-2-yl)methanamine synthase
MTRTRSICPPVVGWDIGGVNTKVARVVPPQAVDGEGAWDPAPKTQPVDVRPRRRITAAVRPYEIQRDPSALPDVLRSLAAEVEAAPGDIHAVTMTAELSQMFRLKRDGVAFVLDAVESAFPSTDVRVYATRGGFLTLDAARREPLAVAASNWAALARAVARFEPNAIVVDVGSTTTDVLPVVDGSLRALGWTDAERLQTLELLYLGAVRTPVEAITHSVPLGDGEAGVSAESFALAADVYIWRGELAASSYTVPTPDGRATDREAVGERLARIVCADRESLDDASIDRIAAAVAEAQIARTLAAIARVRGWHPELTKAIVTGVGEFIAIEAATQAGLSVKRLADEIGANAALGAPASAVALLLSDLVSDEASRVLEPVTHRAPPPQARLPIGLHRE